MLGRFPPQVRREYWSTVSRFNFGTHSLVTTRRLHYKWPCSRINTHILVSPLRTASGTAVDSEQSHGCTHSLRRSYAARIRNCSRNKQNWHSHPEEVNRHRAHK